MIDILNTQDEKGPDYEPNNVREVVNYVNAVNYGLERLESLPFSLRLIREIHQILLTNVRGSTKNPGEFRKSQNWIGPAGCTLENATFIPPAPNEMLKAMSALESFIYEDDRIPERTL